MKHASSLSPSLRGRLPSLLLFALVGVPLFICVGLAGCYLGLRSQWAVRMPDILLRTHDGVRLCDRSAPTALGVFEACGDAQEYNCSLTTFGPGERREAPQSLSLLVQVSTALAHCSPPKSAAQMFRTAALA